MTNEVEYCPDCGAIMIEVCSGLEDMTTGARSCRGEAAKAPDQPVQKTDIDPALRLTELAEAQKRLDDAMAQLALALPEREVRALGSRINDLLAAFARATKSPKRESGGEWQPMTNYDYEEGEILGWHPEYGTRKLEWCDESGAFYTDGGDHTPLSWVEKWMCLPVPTTEIEDATP